MVMNASPNIPDWKHKLNQEHRARLEALGYTFEVTSQGYFVRHKGKGLGGASTLKKPHGRYREANTRDNLDAAVQKAQEHHERGEGGRAVQQYGDILAGSFGIKVKPNIEAPAEPSRFRVTHRQARPKEPPPDT